MMFENPFPDPIEFCILGKNSLSQINLFPEEKKYLKNVSSEVRKLTYTLGRGCAHCILEKYGYNNFPILKDISGAPVFPETLTGSISHTNNWAVAAMAKNDIVKGIGIDIEDLSRKVNPGIKRIIATPDEKKTIEDLPKNQQDKCIKIIFSAKESIYKCVYSISGVPLKFQDLSIKFIDKPGMFSWYLSVECKNLQPESFQYIGKFVIKDDLVMTSVWIFVDNL